MFINLIFFIFFVYFSDETKIEENELAVALKLNKLMLKEYNIQKLSNCIKDKVNKENVLTFYSLAELYKLANISNSSLIYIERCFPMVVETKNFVHIDYSINAKILGSSKLNVQSEVEVYDAAITWLSHNIEARSKYAKQLLLKVRLTLLSEHALNHILEKVLLFSDNNETFSKI